MKTNREITQEFPSDSGLKITVPEGTKVQFVPGAGGGYAIDDNAALIAAGAGKHDVKHRYFYIPKEAVKGLPADATLLRGPLAKKSDDWRETAFHWLIDINGQKFDYYTGPGHVTESGKPKKPLLDDVLYCLVLDADAAEMTFADWCDNLGYDTDSRKALATYEQCQQNADKLRKAKIDIAAERERLQDY